MIINFVMLVLMNHIILVGRCLRSPDVLGLGPDRCCGGGVFSPVVGGLRLGGAAGWVDLFRV